MQKAQPVRYFNDCANRLSSRMQRYQRSFIKPRILFRICKLDGNMLKKTLLFTCSLVRTFCKSTVVETTCGLQN